MGVCRENNSGSGVLWRVNNTIAIGIWWHYGSLSWEQQWQWSFVRCEQHYSHWSFVKLQQQWRYGSLSWEQQWQWKYRDVGTTLSLLLFCVLGSTLTSRETCQVKVPIPLLQARTTLMPLEFSGVRRTLVPLKFSDFSISPQPFNSCVVINRLNC